MKYNREKSGIVVTVPDISAPLTQALEDFNKVQLEKGDLPASQMNFTEHGYVLTKEGMFVLNTEGVGDGQPITPDNKAEIALYPEWVHADGRKTMASMPTGYLNLSDAELIMLPQSKELPLEEFIRSFGSRLENNYNIWLAQLRESELMPMDGS